MKLTIERATFLKALAHGQSVVERRNTIPILANVLLRGEDGALTLSATDLDLALDETVPAEIEQAGAATVSAHMLYDIVRKLPEGAQVEIENDSSADLLRIRAGRSKFNLATLPVEDFPTLSGGDLPHAFAVEAADLRTLVDRTLFAVSTEETRYYLNGIFVHVADQEGTNVLCAVATDGHRLARMQLPLPEGGAEIPGVIVPRKAIGELRKLTEETSEPIAIALSDTRIRMTFGDVVLTSKLIDGTFPDYERVIPKDNDKTLSVDRGAFAQAVDRVSTISSEKTRAIKLKIEPGLLTLSATSTENGSATEELEVSYGETGIEIGFNARYLLDIAGQIESDAAEFILADASSPTIVRDGGDASAIYVLMPMRV